MSMTTPTSASSVLARLLSLALGAAVLAAIPGCGDGPAAPPAEARPAGRAAPAAVPATPESKGTPASKALAERPDAPGAKADAPKPSDAVGTPAAVEDGKIGVPECDEYIEKYTKCIMEKVPESARPHMREAMELSAKAWREAASGPSKDGVASTCKTALEAARQATESLGCDW